ncbi:MAG TPA: hypothetical protein VM123_16915 [archaeon]|nr:hypothetical protein [archaeon]
MKRFEVAVFGKQGCSKCEVVKKRLEKILTDKTYEDLELIYYDLGTVEGLVRFCQCEVLNPQRIPGLIILHKNAPNNPGVSRPVTCRRRLSALDEENTETFIWLETDYSSDGLITPKMIRQILELALQSDAVKV